MQATNRIASIRIAKSCRLDKDHKAPKETRIACSLDLVSIASKTLPNSAAQRMSPRQCKFTIVFLILMARRAVLRFNKRWSSAKASAGTSNTAADVVMLHDFARFCGFLPHPLFWEFRYQIGSAKCFCCDFIHGSWTGRTLQHFVGSPFWLGLLVPFLPCWGGAARCQTPPRWHWIGPRRCRWHKASINQRQTV